MSKKRDELLLRSHSATCCANWTQNTSSALTNLPAKRLRSDTSVPQTTDGSSVSHLQYDLFLNTVEPNGKPEVKVSISSENRKVLKCVLLIYAAGLKPFIAVLDDCNWVHYLFIAIILNLFRPLNWTLSQTLFFTWCPNIYYL